MNSYYMNSYYMNVLYMYFYKLEFGTKYFMF